MRLADVNRLLDTGYTELESAYCRLDDGQLHVAAWTTMFGRTVPATRATPVFNADAIPMALQTGNRAITRVPSPGVDSMVRFPPNKRARSRIPSTPPLVLSAEANAGSKPLPVSLICIVSV
jgi:hypothetical protein